MDNVKILYDDELKTYIMDEINSKIDGAIWNGVYFFKGRNNYPEGTYVYSENEKYHIVSIEKGKIIEKIEYESLVDILWDVLEVVSFPISTKYATENFDKRFDYRRKLFENQIDLYSRFGENFKNKKIKEIKKILEKNPYLDNEEYDVRHSGY